MTTWIPGKPSHVRIEASVRCFDAPQGYGFLAPTGGEPDVFCHISVVHGSGFETLPEGAKVICDIVRRPGNAAVTHIHAVDAATSAGSLSGNRHSWEKIMTRSLKTAVAAATLAALSAIVAARNTLRHSGLPPRAKPGAP